MRSEVRAAGTNSAFLSAHLRLSDEVAISGAPKAVSQFIGRERPGCQSFTRLDGEGSETHERTHRRRPDLELPRRPGLVVDDLERATHVIGDERVGPRVTADMDGGRLCGLHGLRRQVGRADSRRVARLDNEVFELRHRQRQRAVDEQVLVRVEQREPLETLAER